jgi:undecaprenyl-diphosphatase
LVAFPLKSIVEEAMLSYLFIGAGFLATAGIFCLVPLVPQRKKEPSLKVGIAVGLMQGLAVFPGVSRSGTTLAVALFMGLAAPKAFRLSFLMSIPAILGASFLEALEVLRNPVAVMPEGWFFAALAAFGLGSLSLALLRRLVLSGKWPYFGIYCFFLGLFAVVSAIAARF